MSILLNLFILMGVATGVALWTRNRSFRSVVAVLLFLLQVFVGTISFDAAARAALQERISKGALTPDFEAGVRALRDSTYSYRAFAIGLSVLMLGIVVVPQRKKKGS